MKKFLAVFDGFRLSKSTLQYAMQLTQVSDAHLIGVFLDEFSYHSYDAYHVINTEKNYEKVLKQLNTQDTRKRDIAVQKFEKACKSSGINYSVHRDKNIALQDLKHESLFADLIIINENEAFSRVREKLPTRFIKELLSDIQCPVLLVPNSFVSIDRIELLYDGRPSSLYAIKMFSYLLGNLMNLPVEVLTVRNKNVAGTRVPDNKLMKEFIKRHFPKAIYKVEKGDAEEIIPSYLKNHKGNELVVLGAYQRNEVSRWFRHSMADILMKQLDTPLFVAHSR